MSELIWTEFTDASAVAAAACQQIITAAETAIARKQSFKLVLAGGSTPQQCYTLLRNISADWQHWHIYFGDERCLPVDDAERNSLMAQQAWLKHVPIPANQIHAMPTELGAEEGKKAYNKTIGDVLPFDMVLLGMGEDGHTASLFPGHIHPEDELVHAVYNAPKAPAERVSLSSNCLGNTQNLLFLITGEGKRPAVQQWHAGEQLPIATVQGIAHAEVLIDKAAAQR